MKVRSQPGKLSVRWLAAAAWLIVALLPLRAEPIDVGFEQARIDLLPLAEVVQGISAQAIIELPATGGTPRQAISLNARGPGPLYRWAVFTLHNPEAQPRELVIAVPHQRFVASQVLWPLPEGSRVVGLATSDGRAIEPLASPGADAFALTVPPGAMISYVLEVSATGLDDLSLWRRGAFHAMADRYAFFRGMVLGISFLLAVSFICLFIVRPRAVFAAAALFGCAAIAFQAIEAGYLPALLAWAPALAGSEQKLRAVTEGLMLGGVIAVLFSFLELRRRMPLADIASLAAGAAAAALAIYGWFEPRLAIGLIRIAFAAVVAAGLGLIAVLWAQRAARAQASLFGWVVLTLWTVAAALGALDLVDSALMHPLISAGLVLVLVTMGSTLAQFAFGQGLASSEAYEEAGRRALALAASEQAVWDWQADRGRLIVGPEIERALGLEEGVCGHDPAAWLDLIHPADRVTYAAVVEAAERRGRGSFSQEFRLRRADGSYRWYVLRARAMAGGKNGASRLIGTLADVTTLRRSEDRLLADAVRDRLTGLPNRALFLDRLDQAMRRAGDAADAADAGLHVIAVDLDRFKSFNDGLGAEAGDYLLNAVGRRLQTCIGPEDTLARLPGHQFGIILDGSQRASGIMELTEAIGAAVAQPIHLPAGEVVITASMGVARFNPEHRTAGDMLKAAEIALYEAKRRGHGAVEFFRPDMHDERSELLQLERDLRRALERGEIEVVYQPIIRLADRKLAGFEALMRWRRGDIVLEPDSFVGTAEATGVIDELGRYVLNQASGRLGIWQRAFRPQEPLFVAVNISSTQLLNGDLVDDIQRIMEREDLIPGSLKLELTESLVVENPELAHKLLMRLKQMGVALACDDFGTGYSGLESLFRLPFDSVKIDRCFLQGESGDRNWIMVEAMLRLARDLKLDVVAEGIESDEQMEQLSRLGCDYGQGYLIGPPVPAQQVVEALGGFSYGSGLGMGLAAFWTRLTGRGHGEPVARMPPDGRLDFPALHVRRADNGAAAAQPAEDADAEPVIDVRSIMPVPMPPLEPAAPKVGSAPFAPRFKAPDPPQMETASGEAVGALEVRPAEPQQRPAPVVAAAAPEADAAPAVAAASDPADDAGRPEAKRAEPDTRSKRKPRRRKARRAAKTASSKTASSKPSTPKPGPAKARPANGSRQGGPAKQH